jgi:hypothetical protein
VTSRNGLEQVAALNGYRLIVWSSWLPYVSLANSRNAIEIGDSFFFHAPEEVAVLTLLDEARIRATASATFHSIHVCVPRSATAPQQHRNVTHVQMQTSLQSAIGMDYMGGDRVGFAAFGKQGGIDEFSQLRLARAWCSFAFQIERQKSSFERVTGRPCRVQR